MKKENAANITDAEFAIVGSVALMNDLCDWIGLDLLFFRMIDVSTAFILGLWCFFRLYKFPAGKFSATFLVELTPIIGDISPTWTVFIASVYFRRKKALSKM